MERARRTCKRPVICLHTVRLWVPPWPRKQNRFKTFTSPRCGNFIIRLFRCYVTEKAMASHSGTLAWKIPWMEGPGRLQSMGSLRVRYD